MCACGSFSLLSCEALATMHSCDRAPVSKTWEMSGALVVALSEQHPATVFPGEASWLLLLLLEWLPIGRIYATYNKLTP